MLQDFRPYHKVIAIKIVLYWHKNRYINQWKRIEGLETNPHTYDKLTFDKGDRNIQ